MSLRFTPGQVSVKTAAAVLAKASGKLTVDFGLARNNVVGKVASWHGATASRDVKYLGAISGSLKGGVRISLAMPRYGLGNDSFTNAYGEFGYHVKLERLMEVATALEGLCEQLPGASKDVYVPLSAKPTAFNVVAIKTMLEWCAAHLTCPSLNSVSFDCLPFFDTPPESADFTRGLDLCRRWLRASKMIGVRIATADFHDHRFDRSGQTFRDEFVAQLKSQHADVVVYEKVTQFSRGNSTWVFDVWVVAV
jgi:hypothetical protein